MKRSLRTLNYVFSALALVYGIILLFPQILFSHKIKHKNFTVYHHIENIEMEKLAPVLDDALILLKTSPVFDTQKNQNIFLCHSFNEFTFFAPRSRKAFAVNYPLVQNIFLTPSDIDKNVISRNALDNNVRTLSGVIAHETTHSALEDKLGFLQYKLLPSWKNEGYCDYVAKESSYNDELGWMQICAKNEEISSPSFTYFKYKTYVDYLLKEEKVTLDSFLRNDFDTKNLAFKSRKALCPSIVE